MDIEKTIKNLRANGFAVSYFDTAEQALDYMESEIKGETVGFGGSTTVNNWAVRQS
jgi:L-lactate utilization protein LutB